MLTKKSMDGKFVSIRKFFLVFQKFCIIQKGHFWNFINCPFSYIQKVWNGNLLAFFGCIWHFFGCIWHFFGCILYNRKNAKIFLNKYSCILHQLMVYCNYIYCINRLLQFN